MGCTSSDSSFPVSQQEPEKLTIPVVAMEKQQMNDVEVDIDVTLQQTIIEERARLAEESMHAQQVGFKTSYLIIMNIFSVILYLWRSDTM